ncbi:MAG: hypothetical protein RL318_1068 [Fibrobacterota bacterium]|jgi:methyl-accepting chemotaxis protein
MLKNMKIGLRLGLSFGLILSALAAVGTYAIINVAALDKSIDIVVNDRMVKTRQANAWIDGVNAIARILRNEVISNDVAFIVKEDERIPEIRKEFDAAIDSLKESVKSPEGIKKLEEALAFRSEIRSGQDTLRAMAKANRDAEAAALLFGSYREAQSKYLKAVTAFIEFQSELATKDGADAAAAAASLERILILVISALVLFGIFIAWVLTRSIVKPIGQCIEISEKVARGETNVDIVVNSTDETGALLNAMKQMVEAIQRMTSDANLLAVAAKEGKLATRADATKHQGDYRKIVQGVNDTLDSVIGPLNVAARYVDDISKGNIPAKITDSYNGDFNQIKNNLNVCIDAVSSLVTDAAMLSRAAVEGKLSTRADASKHAGDFRKIVQGVNDTLDSVIGPLNVAARYVEQISQGNIPAKITDSYNGDFNQIKNNLNVCIDAVNSLVKDADMLVQAALDGRLSTRADASKHSGDFRKIVQGVNDTLDAVIGPVNEASSVLEKVAARDLTVRMQGSYKGDLAKIKNSLNLAVENLDQALAQVSDSTSQVASASGQISSGSQNLAQGANEQASSLEEVSASLEEMSSMTRQNAENANQAKNLAGEADQNAKVGTDAMTRMSSSIQKIKESSDQTAKIVKTIDEIAMQTNLLALNAAVEAARAGEAGRGFAVVAEEVRNLAQRSAQAAKNTADMIGESVRNADDGVKIATEVSSSFEKIAGSSKKVNDLIAEIAVASKEQAAGIKQVNDAVSQMDKVTQQNAANAEESASASEELSSQAAELQAMVAQFQIGRGNTRMATVASKPSKALPGLRGGDAARKPRLVSPNEIIPMDEDILKEF